MADTKLKTGTKIKATMPDSPEIGIDTDNELQKNIINATEVSTLDISKLESFTSVAQTREQSYRTIDTMAQDSTLAAVIKCYAEDAVLPNDQGKIMWVESKVPNVSKYVTYLLESLNVDKNAYKWAYNLVKYGDVYLKLFRNSDYEDKLFSKTEIDKKEQLNETMNLVDDSFGRYTAEEANKFETKQSFKEDVNLRVHTPNDHYVHYVEMMPNPGEMFELTRFGKTAGFVRAPVPVQTNYNLNSTTMWSTLKYKLNKSDVDIYEATDFVHGCLEDNLGRVPEEVNIFLNNNDYSTDSNPLTYTVKRGQSLLNDVFKIWRELSLLENSILLNRLTRSSIVRILNVDIGDMPKEAVGSFITRLKEKIEQKSAINTGKSMQEYTNPGPIENIIYVPTHGQQGTITAQSIGGDVDPKQLTDLEYYRDKLFAALGVPKQFFGFTSDGAGFDGGKSLSIISSRYGKAIRRIQNTLCQMVTDLINLLLLDKGLVNYINKFTIKMQAPITQEELDRRDNVSNRIRVVGDIMQQLNEVDNKTVKLRVLSSLLSSVVDDPSVSEALQEEIKRLEEEEAKNKEEETSESESSEDSFGVSFDNKEVNDIGDEGPLNSPIETEESEPEEVSNTGEEETQEPTEISSGEVTEPTEDDNYLPNPDELGLDLTVNQ